MNKTALKNFATSARNELIKKVEARALKVGITEESIKKAQLESSDAIYIDGKQLSLTEKKQRDKLIQRIRDIGFKNVVEEVAYTWFNRFIALRFMEVNNYLPTKMRVLSSSEPENPEPDIIKEALSVDLDIDKELVYDLKLNNKTEELFKYMVIKQCNDLNKYLPFMFETIEDYKEILFPEGLLAKESFLRDMTDVTTIPESDWEQVEIIGWLYQYYISERKDQVFADFKNNIKISKENLPAATQLFTPHWIVRYMVENSLGRFWLESYPESPLKSEWKYYLDETEQERQVKDELDKIRRKNINPESITFFDPCCGSGHILVYAFDVFYSMYLEKGYIPHEIPRLILEKNLFGIDIDDRAAQLASFAVMMKAREKSRRVFGQGIKLNICAIQESEWMTDEIINVLVDNSASQTVQNAQRETLHHLRDAFINAKDYGSILKVHNLDLDFIDAWLQEFADDSEYQGNLLQLIAISEALDKMPVLVMQARMLSSNYHVVCTNPPYMGNRNMGTKLRDYVQGNYEKSKTDLCAVFIEVCGSLTKPYGYCSLVTMHSWLFLSSFEALRNQILDNFTTTSILHLGMEAFDGIIGKIVQTAAFVLQRHYIGDYIPTGIRLVDFYDATRHEKESQFFNKDHHYNQVKQNKFKRIPGSPIAYWVSRGYTEAFGRGISIESISKFTGSQNITADNDKYLRKWWEVACQEIGQDRTWVLYAKGGSYRKHYGNLDTVVKWNDEARGFYANNKTSNLLDSYYWYKEGITYTDVSTIGSSFRYLPPGCVFDKSGPTINEVENLYYVLAFLNTKIADNYLKIFNPTMHIQVKDVKNLPLIIDQTILHEIENLEQENVQISKKDWDSLETSYGFLKHPLIGFISEHGRIAVAHEKWSLFAEKQFTSLKNNEEAINKRFIELYELQDDVTPNVSEDDVSVRKIDPEWGIKSFMSYAVGCMFGRYSLDKDGLVFAGGIFEPERYRTFAADSDNIVPVLSGTYFEDDIVFRFVEFVKVTFGDETLTENLEFIADTLGKKDSETPREAIRRYFLNDFFKDHVQTYKKKPLYWLFTSGKQKAFNCLIYMQRYDKTTLSRIRTDYVHELQMRFDAEKKSFLSIIEGDGTAREISTAKKELKTLELKIAELKEYEEVLHHMADQQIEIDLDNGVDVNYEKFEGLLAKRG